MKLDPVQDRSNIVDVLIEGNAISNSNNDYKETTLLQVVINQNKNNIDIYYKQANEWLINNTKKDSIVFYPIWSMFAKMFFYNNHNRYIAGIDPTLLYEYNPDIYYIWANIAYQGIYCHTERPCLNLSPGQELEAAPTALKTILNTEILVIPNNGEMEIYKVLYNRKQDFEEVYRNRELVIFKIRKYAFK